MAIFLDTGKIEEIEKYMKMGIVRGVTTNPTILLKDGISGGMEAVKKRSIEIDQSGIELSTVELKVYTINLSAVPAKRGSCNNFPASFEYFVIIALTAS